MTEMRDREMLELAARAAGIELKWSTIEDLSPRRADTFDSWNPLTDDGDALRLAVKLGLQVTPEPNIECCTVGLPDCWWVEERGDDLHAATRRAIVRAAADIGKTVEVPTKEQ